MMRFTTVVPPLSKDHQCHVISNWGRVVVRQGGGLDPMPAKNWPQMGTYGHFGLVLAIFGNFFEATFGHVWQLLTILGHFWASMGHFWPTFSGGWSNSPSVQKGGGGAPAHRVTDRFWPCTSHQDETFPPQKGYCRHFGAENSQKCWAQSTCRKILTFLGGPRTPQGRSGPP